LESIDTALGAQQPPDFAIILDLDNTLVCARLDPRGFSTDFAFDLEDGGQKVPVYVEKRPYLDALASLAAVFLFTAGTHSCAKQVLIDIDRAGRGSAACSRGRIWLDTKSVASEDTRDKGRIPKPHRPVPVQYTENADVRSRGNSGHDKSVPNSPVRVNSDAQESSCGRAPNTFWNRFTGENQISGPHGKISMGF
jgi:hypothetical protein